MIIYSEDYIKMRMKYDPKGWHDEITSVWNFAKWTGIIFAIITVLIIIFAII